jgi:hypothetical protein
MYSKFPKIKNTFGFFKKYINENNFHSSSINFSQETKKAELHWIHQTKPEEYPVLQIKNINKSQSVCKNLWKKGIPAQLGPNGEITVNFNQQALLRIVNDACLETNQPESTMEKNYKF